MQKQLIAFFLLFSTVFFDIQAQQYDSSKSDLKILSWNIYMLPGIVPVAGRVERAKAITDTLSRLDYDIIVFQEAFHKKALNAIREGLKQHYPFMYGPYNPPKDGFHISSGIWVLSKMPLKELGTTQFFNGKVADKVAQKGAALLEGTVNGKTFQLLGTHVQAQDFPEIRRAQFKQIYEQLLKVHYKENVPQLICGDMNTSPKDSTEYAFMLETLNAENGIISGVQQDSYDASTNKIAHKVWKNGKTTLDYILLRPNGKQLSSTKRQVSVLRKKWRKNQTDLSDHYGIICELKF